jgi:hypothetical protein
LEKISKRSRTIAAAVLIGISWVTELANPITRSFSGVSARYVSVRQPFLEPVQHFSLNPPHAGRAEVDPLRELPGPFQTCDMLR